jgi:hypothetical protein
VADGKDSRQQLIALRVDPQLLAEIDAKRGRKSRSEFLRDAVYAELEAQGTSLPSSITAAPDRAGKGGRPKKVVEMPPAQKNVAEDHGPPPESASAPRQKVKYPKKKGR